MTNVDIRVAVMDSGLRLYELAEELGIHDSKLSKLLRKEMSAEEKVVFFEAIRLAATRKAATRKEREHG